MHAIDDFGILEVRKDEAEQSEEVRSIMERYKTESDHAAMRIAALVSVKSPSLWNRDLI
jgi:hypothetical protein